MTVPGVNVIVAATFMAAIGDIGRFDNPRKLVGYLGLDPRVPQSGRGPPTTGGSQSRVGLGPPRAGRVQLAAVRQPGPLRAFYGRVRARRGHQVAIVAAARKLACLFWCLLTRQEDYAYQQPSLTAKKLRLLEIRAGAPSHKGRYTGTSRPASGCAKPNASSRAGRDRLQAHGHANGNAPKQRTRAPARHRGAHLKAVKRQAARQVKAPDPAL